MRALPFRAALLLTIVALVVGSGLIFTAGNAVPSSHVGSKVSSISATDPTPGACASLGVTVRVTGAGSINGKAASELILGSSGADSIQAGGGNDCVVGGGGADTINGGGGTDVCIGGPATDSFSGCETVIQ
jgi:Ca2+-binding RTX toxin-like protein